MIPNSTNTLQTEGGFGGSTTAFSFDEDSFIHLMSLMSDLYSDIVKAIIREYSTNALDSHREAGNPAPIQVITPTALSPYFKVRDFGVGLSVNEIEHVYSKYGKSTKRESNEAVGMLGLGCKSALAYTNTFTIIAVKNGVKTHAVISKDSRGVGEIHVVDTVATNEHSGVEVSIPVSDRTDFDAKCDDFFQYWETGTVLVNGTQPERFEATPLSDTLFAKERSNSWGYSSNNVVVMGNVAYPVENFENQLKTRYQFDMVAYVPMGAIEFPPSREELKYTALTKDTLDGLANNFNALLEAAATKEIVEATSAPEAWNAWMKWKPTFPGIVSKYQGQDLAARLAFQATQWRPSRTRYSVENTYGAVNISDIKGSLCIKNFPGGALTSTNKRKIREYISLNITDKVERVYLSPTLPDSPWVDDFHTADWSDIVAIRFPKVPGQSNRRPNQTWDYWDASGYHYAADDLPKGQYYYFSYAQHKNVDTPRVLTFLPPGGIIVSLGTNRHGKFLRENPGAKYLFAACSARIKELAKDATEEYFIISSMDYSTKRDLSRLDAAQVLDPEVVKMINLVNNESKYSKSGYVSACGLASLVGQARPPAPSNTATQYDLSDKYPLVSVSYLNHSYCYINAVFEAEKGNK